MIETEKESTFKQTNQHGPKAGNPIMSYESRISNRCEDNQYMNCDVIEVQGRVV